MNVRGRGRSEGSGPRERRGEGGRTIATQVERIRESIMCIENVTIKLSSHRKRVT